MELLVFIAHVCFKFKDYMILIFVEFKTNIGFNSMQSKIYIFKNIYQNSKTLDFKGFYSFKFNIYAKTNFS